MLLTSAFFLAVLVLVAASLILAQRLAGARGSVLSPAAQAPGDRETAVLLRDESLSTISFWQKVLTRFQGIDAVQGKIEQAGLRWTVGRLTAMMLLSGSAAAVVCWRIAWISNSVMFVLAAVAALGPYAVVLRRRRQRLERIAVMFPDMLDSLARSLRAGNPLATALDLWAREGGQPLSGELRRLVDERNLGLDWNLALENFAQRIPLTETRVFAAAILLNSRAGGRLNDVVAGLAENIREAAALRSEARAIAAQGKATGKILTALPVAIALIMAYLNPAALVILWNDPVGNRLIWLSATCVVLAWVVIRRMVEAR